MPPEDLSCAMCGVVLRRAPRTSVAVEEPPRVALQYHRPPNCERHTTSLKYLGVGAALALVFGLTPLLRYMGWFLASLFHETGHCVAAWIAGCPAFPAIRLDGHAAAVHGGQHVWLCLIVWGALGLLLRRHWANRRVHWLCCAVVAVYPLIVFTGARDIWVLVAGHGGELAFATIALQRALSGGFTNSKPERLLYAAVGWYLLGRNVLLTAGLAVDEAAREEYTGNGSFGLANDYLRVARTLQVDLATVAWMMTLLACTVLPLAWKLSRFRRKGQR
jgi:hypothetical protein